MSVKSRPQSARQAHHGEDAAYRKKAVFDFVGYSFECIGFRHELCKLGFIGFFVFFVHRVLAGTHLFSLCLEMCGQGLQSESLCLIVNDEYMFCIIE